MATLSFGVNGPTITLNVAMEVTDDEATRMLTYLMATHGVDSDGNLRAPETVAEVFASDVLYKLLAQTEQYERKLAVQAALASVAPIIPTVV
jgi:hypothetical protein